MDLYRSIFQRKSSRKYTMEPPTPELLDEMRGAIDGFARLYPDVEVGYRFTSTVKGLYHVDAPQYLIVTGNGRAGEMEAAGFLFEQLVLWLDARDLGSVWLGSSKDTEAADTAHDILAIAFGAAADSVHRTLDQFKRKPIEEITNAPDDRRIQAARLAPSGMNTQPWYFEKTDSGVLLYEKKLKPPLSLAYKLSDIDMGIGLSHFAIAAEETGGSFAFERTSELPKKPGYTPFGIIG